jgi:hypothetical protein
MCVHSERCKLYDGNKCLRLATTSPEIALLTTICTESKRKFTGPDLISFMVLTLESTETFLYQLFHSHPPPHSYLKNSSAIGFRLRRATNIQFRYVHTQVQSQLTKTKREIKKNKFIGSKLRLSTQSYLFMICARQCVG